MLAPFVVAFATRVLDAPPLDFQVHVHPNVCCESFVSKNLSCCGLLWGYGCFFSCFSAYDPTPSPLTGVLILP